MKVLVILLGVSLLVNTYFVYKIYLLTPVTTQSETPKEEDYPFLAKRIFVEHPTDIIINFMDLRNEMKQYTASLGGQIGVYFEYLPTGTHIGINDREAFRRASLVKIPVVMNTYKLLEEKKLDRKDVLKLSEAQIDSRFGDLWKRGVGAEIRVEEAVRFALVESDNTAHNMLRDKVAEITKTDSGSDNQIHYLYDYLDISRESQGKTLDISPRNFSSILKSLYFSAYLSYESSNEMIEIMTTALSPYRLLPAGLPEDVAIAHKFGVNRDETGENIVTSDCGIIYYPKRPYILCIMVGLPPEKASSYIVGISKMTYDFVSSVNTE